MKVTSERLPESQMLLNVEVDGEDLEAHKDRAYRRLVQRAAVPGFRKGKAPRRILEQFIGPGALLQEALDTLLPEMTARAIEDQGIEAVGQPTIEVQETEPVVFKATVPLKPAVELGDYLSLRVPSEEPQTTDEQVDEALERLRAEATPWEPAERPVQMGDLLTLQVRGTVKGLPAQERAAVGSEETAADQPEERVFLNEENWTYNPRLESAFPVPGFADQIVGLEKGGTREFTLTPPEDHTVADLAGQECHFTVVLTEVKEQRLPEIDDEWAKGVADSYASLAELRQRIFDDLKARTEQEARRRYEDEALERLVSGATVEYPPVLAEHEMEHLLRDRQERLRALGIGLDDYLTMQGKSREDLMEELRPEAQRRVVNTLVLDELIQSEGMEVTDEEIDGEAQLLVGEEASEEGREQVERLLASPETRATLRRNLLTRHAIDRLVQIAREKAPSGPGGEGTEETTTEVVPKEIEAEAEERSQEP